MKDWKTTVRERGDSSRAALLSLGQVIDLQSPEAMEESLEHLLSIPIENAVNQLPRALADKLRPASVQTTISRQKARINTFGELLAHPHPPIEMLKFAKEFGKAIVIHGKAVWPKSVCEVLYYGSYAAGLARQRERIGTLTKADLQDGFRKLAARPWIAENLKGLLRQAAGQLSASAGRRQAHERG